MAGMFVMATEAGPPSTLPSSGGGARTLADGSFQLEQLARKAYNLLAGSELSGYGFRPNVRPGGSDVELALSLGGRVAVFVRSTDGEPAGGPCLPLFG